MQAATAEIGGSLVQTVTVSTAAGAKQGEGSQGAGQLPQPLVAVGGIGMELLRVGSNKYSNTNIRLQN